MKRKSNPRKNARPLRYDRANIWRRLLDMMFCALITALVVEGFNQGSLIRLWDYLRGRTLYFFVNCLVILSTLSLSELFRHRRAMNIAMSALWMVLGVANFLVIRNRTQPLAGGDLLLDYQTVMLGMAYFSWFQIIGVFLAAIVLVMAIAWLFSHTALRKRVNYCFSLCIIAMMAMMILFTNMSLMKAGLLPHAFSDRVTAYKDYGFTTCFAITFGQLGIEKPDEYSTETVEEILTEVDQAETVEAEPTPVPRNLRFTPEQMETPNIVFLQLESFFDVNTMRDTLLSQDPTPNFHRLLEKYPNGLLHVPTVGGGTANVEFEVMSGFNMDLFGAGETPYNTIIQESVCETIAHTLRDRGYASTALHNNTGTFFSRSQVYANLGYDRFDSLEYMPDAEYNAAGWARDQVLTGEILRALKTTDERDLIFAISVESHGKYGETYTPAEDDIEVIAAPEEIFLAPFQNYVNVIPSVDRFLDEILRALDSYPEPVAAVIYGDHLPGLGLTADMLTTGDLYASQYVIWNNYGAEFEAPDMQAYRLSAELLRQLGISDGVMTRFHQAYPVYEDGGEYQEKLQILQYDMLYGDQEIYSASGAPESTVLQMGVEPITLSSAIREYGRLMVTGEHFTEFSRIAVEDKILDTVYIDANHIAAIAEDSLLQETGRIAVAQINSDGTELSRTEEIEIQFELQTK